LRSPKTSAGPGDPCHRLVAIAGDHLYGCDVSTLSWQRLAAPSANWTVIACSADGERLVGVSSQGTFLSPDPSFEPAAVPLIQAGTDPSGIRLVWQGTPHRTHRLISTRDLGRQPWRSAGAVLADAEGRVFVTESANEPQHFWQVLEEGERMAERPRRHLDH